MNTPVVYYWKPGDGENFGDSLGPAIVNAMMELAQRQRQPAAEETDAGHIRVTNDPRACPKLMTVGSVIQFARSGDTLWGTGVRSETQVLQNSDGLTLLALRGRLSAEALGRNPGDTVMGDPAMLLPYLAEGLNWPLPYRQWRPPGTGRVALIPNLRQLWQLSSWPGFPWERDRVRIVSPYLPWHEVLRRILECDCVLATSLHGLILAESFGVPARWIASPSLEEGTFKFRDYYSSTGRVFDPAEHCEDLNEGLARFRAENGEGFLRTSSQLHWDPVPLWNAFPWGAFGAAVPPCPGSHRVNGRASNR